jgi:zinc transporter, ZIP family
VPKTTPDSFDQTTFSSDESNADDYQPSAAVKGLAMWEAVVFGVLASGSLVLGGALGSYWPAPTRATGVMLAFASGMLISALAFQLYPEAIELGGLARAGWGLLFGALAFVLLNTWLDSRVAPPEEVGEVEGVDPDRPSEESPASAEAEAVARGDADEIPSELAGAVTDQREKVAIASQGIGLTLLASVTLDGIPENLALGVSLAGEEATGGASIALLVAIFASNFPEALVGAVAMRSQDRSPRYIIGLWGAASVLLTIAVVVGRMALANAEPTTIAFLLAFAGGAVLASLADTLMPEAYERGRPLNAFASAGGFFLAFVLAEL